MVERIVTALGETNGPLAARIQRLAHNGTVGPSTVSLLQAVRLVGNTNAVHEGQLTEDGEDSAETVELLFRIVNKLAEDHRSLPRQAAAIEASESSRAPR